LNGHTDTVNATAFSHDNSILASSSNDRTTKIWDLATNTCTDTINEYGTHLAFSPDNKNLAIATKDSIIIWNIKMNRCEQHLKGHTNLVSSIYFSADGTLLASASFDETVKIWDIKTGQCLQTLTQHIDFVESVCFTPDNTKLISSSMDQTINIYSRCNIKEEFTLSTLLFLDYALSYKTLETWEQLPSEEFYFDLYYELPEVFQKMIIDMFDQDALNSYLEIKKN
jgi:WD40 repeat protein